MNRTSFRRLGWAFLFLISAFHSHADPAKAPRRRALSAALRPDRVAGEFIVKYRSPQDESQTLSLHHVAAVQSLGSRPGPSRFKLIRLSETAPAADAVASFQSDPLVEYIQPNYIYYADVVPNDPNFGLQWAHQNTGQSVNAVSGASDADMDTAEAWDIASGAAQVVVAVLDTGVDIDHPDLAANVWVNPGEIPGDGLDNDHDGFVDDVNGWDFFDNDKDPRDYHSHGSHVAGIIGAVGNNGVGVAGVAWNVKIMPVKIMGVQGFSTSAKEIAGINYAVAEGAKIINASWGSLGLFDQALKDAIDAAGTAGVLFVAAAGNNAVNTDSTAHYPSAYVSPNIISVAATTQGDALASFNFGAVSVDVGAPGANIYSTIPTLTPDASRQLLYSKSFDSDADGAAPAGWVVTGTAGHTHPWTVKTGEAISGAKSLQDSPDGNYAANADSRVWFFPSWTAKDSVYEVDYQAKYDLESGFDFLDFVSATNIFDTDISIHLSHTGTVPAFLPETVAGPAVSAAIEAGERLGFRLDTDFAVNAGGVKIDDFKVFKRPLGITAHTYGFNSGTSMASPEVAGVTALTWGLLPHASAAQIKALVLNNVDALPALAGKTVTGGRVNAQKAVTAAQALVLTTPVMNAPAVLGTSSITWSWSDLSNETGYRVRRVSDGANLSGDLPAGTVSWTQTGLLGGSSQRLAVEAFNTHDLKSASPQQASTLAVPPAGTSLAAVFFTSATLAWTGGGNAAGTIYKAEKSLDNASFTEFFSGAALSTAAAGLSELTTYYFRVRAQNGDGVPTAYDVPLSTRTKEFLPAAPSGFHLSTRTADSLSWSWTDNAANELGYRVRRSSDDADLSGDLPAGTTAWTQAPLSANQFQQVRVEAFRETNRSLSPPTSAYTLAGPPSGTAAGVFVSSVTLSWADGGNPAGTVYRAEKSANNSTFTEFFSGAALTALAKGLSNNTTYYFRVRAQNANKVLTAYDAAVVVRTLQSPPSAPTGLKASARTTDSITWAWNDTAGNELGYRVHRFSDDADLSGDLPPNAHKWVQTSLSTNSVQQVYVEAFRLTNQASSPSRAAYTAVSTPTLTNVIAVSSTTATLSWSDNGNPAGTSYVVQKKKNVSGGSFNIALTTTSTTVLLMGLSPATPYIFRVAAKNGDAVLSAYDVKVSTGTKSAGSAAIRLGNPLSFSGAFPADNTFKAFPNPFRPALGHAAVNFIGLPPGATIRLFTAVGELVRELSADPQGKASWDGRNEGGQAVASGTYIYSAEDAQGQRKTGRLLVIR